MREETIYTIWSEYDVGLEDLAYRSKETAWRAFAKAWKDQEMDKEIEMSSNEARDSGLVIIEEKVLV